MTENPITFNRENVLAVLAGAKTQTRRVCNPQPDSVVNGLPAYSGAKARLLPTCPYGRVGGRLWVKETFAHQPGDESCAGWGPWYRAESEDKPGHLNWTGPRFMPQWASRITLEITGIRVERVQDISVDDAVAEGVCHERPDELFPPYPPIDCFMLLWDSINAKRGYSWETNPYVWVVNFKRSEK